MIKRITIVFFISSLFYLISCTINHQSFKQSNQQTPQSLHDQIAPSFKIELSDYQEEQFAHFVESLKITAKNRGFSQNTIDQAFIDVYLLQRSIQSDKNQLEKKLTLDDYLKRVLTKQRIEKGRENFLKYREKLARQSDKYNIPPQYIVALWGMESSYGKLKGKENIISAMASLAFEGRRETFFVNQLMDALQIIEHDHIKAEQLIGSWAGAMGQCQFMPSSFIKYAADGDDDGIIDIWNNIDDVFASTANYLAKEGWDANLRWGSEVKLPDNFNQMLAGLGANKAKTVDEWQKIGVNFNIKNSEELTKNAWIIVPDDLQGRAFLVFNNFNVLMHWNRSYYFALSVSMLADSIIEL